MPAKYHYNPNGTTHGGSPAFWADSATGCAVYTMLPAGVGYSTLEIETSLRRRKSLALPVLWELPSEQRSARVRHASLLVKLEELGLVGFAEVRTNVLHHVVLVIIQRYKPVRQVESLHFLDYYRYVSPFSF